MEEKPNPSADSPSPLEPFGSFPAETILSKSECYQPSRLGIIHFLAWMTIAAVLLSLDFSLKTFSPGPISQNQSDMNAWRAAIDIILAAFLVGGGVLSIDCFRGKPGAFQPGHWIVAISAFQFSVEWAIFCFYRRFANTILFNPNRTNLSIVWVVVLFLTALLYRRGAWKLIERGPWKWILGFMAVRCLCDSINILSYYTELFLIMPLWIFVVFSLYTPLAGLLIFATMGDFGNGLRRDWLHWLGAAAFLAMMVFFDLIMGAGLKTVHW
jgi:hypothetical protein